jgi:ABC-type Mn2+/Zn2+ transport system ATPase subunit
MATLDIAAEAVTRTSSRSALSMKSASRSSRRAWSVRWGPNGSGKTTTLRILLGLVTATVTPT